MNTQKLICTCNEVKYQDVIDAVNDGCTTVEEVQERTHCGYGCGRCKAFLRSYVEELLEEKQA
ncbi:MAG: (2Fe-2S)-binding protein [Clostridia bacterium]|nr:(2Fe-2S)-binding protein [Clostridia bacterium]